MSYRDTLAESLKQKGQKLRLILSPPRSGSTLMGASQGNSPDAFYSADSHEPFIELKRDSKNADTGFDKLCKLSDEAPNQATIITKEMSHWLAINNTYQDLVRYIDTPILVLIRNPLLNIESRMRKVLETMTLRPKRTVIEHISGQKIDEADITLEHQLFCLDSYAQARNIPNWNLMLNLAKECGDFRFFDEFLQIDKVLDLEGFGWEALDEEVNFFREQGIAFRIVDSTEHRADPEIMTQAIASEWEIQYTEEMVFWDNALHLETGQNNPHQQIWYSKLQKSRGIKEPYERPLQFEHFPEFLRPYISDVAMPLYQNIYHAEERIVPSADVLDREILVKTAEGDFEMPLRYVDPVYAHVSNPGLIYSDPYLKRELQRNGLFSFNTQVIRDFKDV